MTTKTFMTRGIELLALVVTLPLLTSCGPREVVRFPDGVNLLRNGGFETGQFDPDPNRVMRVSPNDSTTIDGWTVTGNATQNVVWLENGNGPGIITQDGKRFLDLTGEPDPPNPPFQGVMQHFPTTIGFQYRVAFVLGATKNFGDTIAVTVSWSTGPNQQNHVDLACGPVVLPGDPFQWTPDPGPGPEIVAGACDVRFKATAAESYLRIFGSRGRRYIGLDRVSVECVAPLGRHALCN